MNKKWLRNPMHEVYLWTDILRLRFLLPFCYTWFAVIFFPFPLKPVAAEREPYRNRCKLPALLRTYDPEGYELLRSGLEDDWDYSSYISDQDRPLDSLGTVVHEAFHFYAYSHGRYSIDPDTNFVNHTEVFYLGQRHMALIRYEDIFMTERAAGRIPVKLRTFRYAAYVGKDSALSSNQDGIYGLINEFCAYYWGMHAMESIFPYLQKHAVSVKDWKAFVTDYCNYRNAYAEFYFYILEYFRYAKHSKPDVYRQLLRNRALICTLRTMQQRYEKLIRRYERRLNILSRQYNGRSLKRSSIHGIIRIGQYGWGAGDNAYDILMPVIRSRRYRTIRRRLFG